MNKIAAAKAVGTYLLVVVPIGAWIGGYIWALTTSQSENVQVFIGFMPLWLATVGLFTFVLIVNPIRLMYRSYDRGN